MTGSPYDPSGAYLRFADMDTRAHAEPATTNESAIPRPALLLGWAGVIPFAALSAALLAGLEPIGDIALRGLPAYAAVILGFMGGVQWGLEMSRADPAGPAKMHPGEADTPSASFQRCLPRQR